MPGKPKGLPKTGGRVAGKPNRVTTEFRDVVNALLEKNASNVETWLSAVADGNPEYDIKPDPYKALELLHKLAEYSFPKLARTEAVLEHKGAFTVTMTDKDAKL